MDRNLGWHKFLDLAAPRTSRESHGWVLLSGSNGLIERLAICERLDMKKHTNRWWSLIVAAAFVVAVGCAPLGPLRKADHLTLSETDDGACSAKYRASDRAIVDTARDFQSSPRKRDRFLEREASHIDKSDPCFITSYEQHDDYDLFYTEFDDEGNATDVAKGSAYTDSELFVVETELPKLLAKWHALNLVVFTHGWHGSADATDAYSIEFKGLLSDITDRETRGAAPRAEKLASRGEPNRIYHTVGIEVAWRGDSFGSGTYAKYFNVWDRKLAADTISKGGVHELLAWLNQFYLDNSCHGANRTYPTCGSVHMLSLAHSFGALIDFQSFVGRLESGLNVGVCDRAYGFGDMTILLNPAFEGARYRSYFNTAINRSEYFGDGNLPSGCTSSTAQLDVGPQVPTVVVLQSLGDWATGVTFPIFRWISSPFEQSLSHHEAIEQRHAVGWIKAFQTHSLDPTKPKDLVDRCEVADAFRGRQGAPKSYCPFDGKLAETDRLSSNRTNGVVLTFDPSYLQQVPPSYMPAWSIKVSKEIMADHDDYWNPQVIRLVGTLFQDAYDQAEKLHGERSLTGSDLPGEADKSSGVATE
jgi:hypothetical protein